MPGITDRFTGEPLLKVSKLGHGTLEVVDLARSRKFYEEVLGLEVIQPSARSMMIRLNTEHSYAVVETGKESSMTMLAHNGLDVGSPEEVQAAYEKILSVKDKYGIKSVTEPRHMHGDTSFYFTDPDGNWWEIVAVREGGYAVDFDDEERDLTGLHEFDEDGGNVNFSHTHDAEFRKKVREVLDARAKTSAQA
ncbi:MAG: VOC family protein [Rhodococcus sp. (in: high G+C Gram-positive bacteria)]|uniref:VOC family protein n=1 Tax=Rhodococcus sp. TaxID=1831 RepID=UPI003BB1C622